MIIKYVKNSKNKNNKVAGRYSYVTHREKASWIYENTLERFDFAVKKRFKDKQDTTHYVVAFDRKLTEEEKKKARQVISDFWFRKFGTEYFLSIAEHNDKEYTHYHILLSRHLDTGKMLNTVLKAKQYQQLQKELRAELEQAELLNEREKQLNQKYLNSTEVKRSLTAYQHKLYKELKEKIKNGEYVELTKKNAKSFAKAFAEVLAEFIKNNEEEKADKLLKAYDLELKIESKKNRKRLYLYSKSLRVRIDNLSDDYKQKLIHYVEQKDVFEVVKETVEALKEKKKQEQELKQKQNEDVFSVLREMIEEHKKKEKEQEEEFENKKRFRGPRM